MIFLIEKMTIRSTPLSFSPPIALFYSVKIEQFFLLCNEKCSYKNRTNNFTKKNTQKCTFDEL